MGIFYGVGLVVSGELLGFGVVVGDGEGEVLGVVVGVGVGT